MIAKLGEIMMDISQDKLLDILENEKDKEIIQKAVIYSALILEKCTCNVNTFEENDCINEKNYNKENLIEGLICLFHRKVIDPTVIIYALSKSYDISLKDFYLGVLKEAFEKMDEAYNLLFQTIIALENIGEKIVASNDLSLSEVKENYLSVKKYLCQVVKEIN